MQECFLQACRLRAHRWPMCIASNLPKATLTVSMPAHGLRGHFQSFAPRYSTTGFWRFKLSDISSVCCEMGD